MALRQVFNTQLTNVDTSARDIVGSLRWEDEKLYKYVKLSNGTTVAGVAGDPVCYKSGGATVAGTAATVSLDLTDGDAQPILAGFLTAAVTGTLNTSYYLWIQLSGVVTVPLAVTSGVIGSGCMLGTAAGGTDKTLIVSTGVINAGAVLLTTSAASNKVIADCLIGA